jgi:hypothetical protein
MIHLMLLYIVAFGSRAEPLNLEQEYLRKLNHSHSARSVDLLQSTFEQIRMLRLACHLQLESSLVPTSCFEVLHFEERWGLRSRRERERAVQDLDERCRKAAQGLRLPSSISSTSELTKSCLHYVEEARAIQAYRARDSDIWSGY